MQQWEYLFVHIAPASGYNEVVYRPYKTSEERLPRWKAGPTWMEYFKQLGNQGWEFVAWEADFVDEPAIGGKLAIFKRPRESAREAMPAPPPQAIQPPHRPMPPSPPPFIEE
ncbi:MAG: hypothetical protein JW910_06975 [Anaerolineae bacterium]|nr:hypothetical protein [Anaerolineae bacterium]